MKLRPLRDSAGGSKYRGRAKRWLANEIVGGELHCLGLGMRWNPIADVGSEAPLATHSLGTNLPTGCVNPLRIVRRWRCELLDIPIGSARRLLRQSRKGREAPMCVRIRDKCRGRIILVYLTLYHCHACLLWRWWGWRRRGGYPVGWVRVSRAVYRLRALFAGAARFCD